MRNRYVVTSLAMTGALLVGCGDTHEGSSAHPSTIAQSDAEPTTTTQPDYGKYGSRFLSTEIGVCGDFGTAIPAYLSPSEVGYEATQDPNVLVQFNKRLAAQELKDFDDEYGGNESLDSLSDLTFIRDESPGDDYIGLRSSALDNPGDIACMTEEGQARLVLTTGGAAIRGLMIATSEESKPK